MSRVAKMLFHHSARGETLTGLRQTVQPDGERSRQLGWMAATRPTPRPNLSA